MATRQWAVTTNGTHDFNDPANWQFGTVPGIFDIAQFNTSVDDIVTGNATLAELLVTLGFIELTGSYTISGAQPTELSIGAGSELYIEPGASISGAGNIVVNGILEVGGVLAGASASFTSADLDIDPGAVFDVGSTSFSGNNFIFAGGSADLRVINAIQVSGSIYGVGTELFIPGTISGMGSLTVFSGSTELDGNNTYSGGTTLPAGLLAVGNANALGTGALTITGGELLATTTETIANNVTMSGSFTIAAAHGQTLTFPHGASWTINSGSGDVITFGAPGQDGTVAWSFANSSGINPGGYTVSVQAGTLTGPALSLLTSSDQHTIVAAGATLDAGGPSLAVNDLTGGGHVTSSGGATTLFVNGGNFGGVIDGPLALRVLNASVTLSANNAYTGGTTIDSGATLALGNGGTTGSVPGAITDNGILAINHSDNFIVNNVSGTGQLLQTGPGNTWLGTGLNYTGGTLISAGTLIVNDPAALGSGALTINGGELLAGLTGTINNPSLTVSRNSTIAAAHGQTLTLTTSSLQWAPNIDGVIAFGAPGQDGTVAFGATGGGISGVPYTVLVQAGTLRPADNIGLNAVLIDDAHTTILASATLDAAGFGLTVHDLHGGGQVADSGGAATLTVNGGNFSGVIGGPLHLTVTGAAPLTLSGNNTYIGATTINSGATLTLGAGGTTGSVPGIITDNGILAINRSDSFVVNNVSGTGQLQQIGRASRGSGPV